MSWSTEPAETIFYEAVQSPPVDDYKSNLGRLQDMRMRLRHTTRSYSFAQLVAELDAYEGGEAVSALRGVGVPGMKRAQMWGQMIASGHGAGYSSS